ncbi:MAG: glycogen synthase [Patescibacteria group bacterium]|jgi:starch synthase
MNVLFGVSELATVYQLGGLGDVAHSLPLALQHEGADIRIALPFHSAITPQKHWRKEEEILVIFDAKPELVTVWRATVPDTTLPLYLFANNTYLSQPSGVADDSIDKFVFFSLALCTWLREKQEPWQPTLIHLNDWHTALVPAIFRHLYNSNGYKSLLTIHNLNFQGVAPQTVIQKTGINLSSCPILKWDTENGDVNLLMEGIIHADYVNTVSPTYAKEILTPEYGAFLDPVINSLSGKLSGILNGIDYNIWNPETDPHIIPYSPKTALEGKKQNKALVQKELGLPTNPQATLVSYIGRVDGKQKGVELILEALKNGTLGTAKRQFAFLGTGDQWLEDEIINISVQNPNVVAVCKFDPVLAHKLYAASEVIIMPSKYEPCGLVQMIAMRYGTIPVVRKTGGLADTVSEGENGFLFSDYSTQAFCTALHKAWAAIDSKDKLIYIQTQCMKKDFSWKQSAKNYYSLYQQIAGRSF